MCTVTFSPRKTGYALAMNRDELLTRPAGRPPARIKLNGRAVLCPSEPGGGTWIAVNQDRACFALLNWYSVASRVQGIAVSRGKIILTVGSAASQVTANALLGKFPVRKTNPFRLIGFFPDTKEIVEWRWDLKRLACKNHRWQLQQWISSGYDEQTAQRVRSGTCRQAAKQSSVGSLEWLRRLHRSHLPESGPFSTCMHRADAATVSFTEVAVTMRRVSMRYLPCSPCQTEPARWFSAGWKF
jgi:hypothetical protein